MQLRKDILLGLVILSIGLGFGLGIAAAPDILGRPEGLRGRLRCAGTLGLRQERQAKISLDRLRAIRNFNVDGLGSKSAHLDGHMIHTGLTDL